MDTRTWIMTLLGATAGAAALLPIPALAPFHDALLLLAGTLGGGAHVPRSGESKSLAQARAALHLLAEKIEAEK